MERPKKSLMEKYDIPIHKLDFGYVKDCKDARELEKIVQILRSNEEGYFPDLTKCAEDRLKDLKPNSKLFRFEEEIKKREYLSAEELKPIYEMTDDLKVKDNTLTDLVKDGHKKEELEEILEKYPIRKSAKISKKAEEEHDVKKSPNKCLVKSSQKVAATDYRKWDKYDAEAEVLKIELEEERAREEAEIENRMAEVKNKKKLIEEIPLASNTTELTSKLSDLEKAKLSEVYRLRGNEYFREKDYEKAVAEYSKAIEIDPPAAATAFNNRAAAYLKLKQYLKAISDCENCLELEPNNLKALLRKAEATMQNGKQMQAFDLYQQVLEIYPDNATALKGLENIKKDLKELPPTNATRLIIEECSNKPAPPAAASSSSSTASSKVQPVATKVPSAGSKPSEPSKPKKQIGNGKGDHLKTSDYDLAELVKPNNIKTPKMNPLAIPEDSAERKEKKGSSLLMKPQQEDNASELLLPSQVKKPFSKVLIEEV